MDVISRLKMIFITPDENQFSIIYCKEEKKDILYLSLTDYNNKEIKSSYLIDGIKQMLSFYTPKENLKIFFDGYKDPLLYFQTMKEIYLRELEFSYASIQYETISPLLNSIHFIKEEMETLQMPLQIHFDMQTSLNKKRKEKLQGKLSIEEALKELEDDVLGNENKIVYAFQNGENTSRFELAYLLHYMNIFRKPVVLKNTNKNENISFWIKTIQDVLPEYNVEIEPKEEEPYAKIIYLKNKKELKALKIS